MKMLIDPDVQAVAEFMQNRIAVNRLVPVAEGLAKMATILWGRFIPEEVAILRLEEQPLTSVCGQRTQSSAIE